jgi:hypothetical protein
MKERVTIAAVVLVVVGVAATVIAVKSHGSAQGEPFLSALPGQRYIVSNSPNQTPRVSQALSSLRGKGFMDINPNQIPEHLTASTRTIVFTTDAFRATPAAVLQSAYQRGIVLVAFNVSLSELVGVAGPARASSDHFPQGFLTPTSNSTIYSLARLCVDRDFLHGIFRLSFVGGCVVQSHFAQRRDAQGGKTDMTQERTLSLM